MLILRHTLPIMLLGLALSWPLAASARAYGPVKNQDTLWSIATQLRPDKSATVQQTMLAIYYKNPHAFANNNINSLLKGVVLQAPSSAEARRFKRIAALREARKHNHFWKRGVDLPKSAAPPIPTLKKRTVTQRPKPVATKNRVAYMLNPDRVNRRIARLQAQLKVAETKNQQLVTALKTLEAKQSKGKTTPDLDAQVKKLKSELQDLTAVLDQKDNHIKTLQASLKSASETIKSQHADNMRLYDKLKQVSPNSVSAPKPADGKTELKLTTVEDGTKSTQEAATKAANEANTTTTNTATNTNPSLVNETAPNAANITETNTAKPNTVWADQQAATTPAAKTEAPKPDTESTTKPVDAQPPAAKPVEPSSQAPATTPQTAVAGLAATGDKTLENKTTPNPSPEPTLSSAVKPTNTASLNTANSATEQTVTTANPTTSETAAIAPAEPKPTTDQTSTKPLTAETVKAEPVSQAASSTTPQAAANLAPTNDVKEASSIPLTQMINDSKALTNQNSAKTETQHRVSPLALAVALISLLFILALIWRAVLQQREMRRIEAEEARIADRMRKRLEENQLAVSSAVTVVERKEPELEPNSETKA